MKSYAPIYSGIYRVNLYSHRMLLVFRLLLVVIMVTRHSSLEHRSLFCYMTKVGLTLRCLCAN
jgi:hypothetical protein